MLDNTSSNESFGSKKNIPWPSLIDLGRLALGLFIVVLASLIFVIQIPANDGFGLTKLLGLPQPLFELLIMVAYVGLIGLIIRLYLLRFYPRSIKQPRYFWLFLVLVLTFVGLARILISLDNLYLPYLFPLATLAILLAVLLDVQFSILVTVLAGLMIGYLADHSLELAVYAVMGSLIGILSLGQAERMNRLLWAGAYVALSNIIVVLIFYAPGHSVGSLKLLTLLAAAGLNGMFSASLALIGFFLVGQLFGLTTSLQLLDLARPTQPLLRQLLLRAPGTYHHSLLVSNLAEQAAERIGANAFLTRVGTYYHDIGKIKRPFFFIENQLQGNNVQDQLEPQISAQIIISHVEDGLELAKKFGLPPDLQVFIAEHHGTSLVKYFYQQAQDQAVGSNHVNEMDFRYPGPKPQRKETAIVMLADSCEAAVRAAPPASIGELEQLIHRIITGKVGDGELDECDLTMHDLEQIQQTFVEMLQGVFHRRVMYPQENEEKSTKTKLFTQAASPSSLTVKSSAVRSSATS